MVYKRQYGYKAYARKKNAWSGPNRFTSRNGRVFKNGRQVMRQRSRRPAYRANAGRAANYATFQANQPEVKYMDHSFGDTTTAVPNTWTNLFVRNLAPLSAGSFPIIPQGLTSTSKVGNKAKLISLEIKAYPVMGLANNSIAEELLEIMLVRKGQCNRVDQNFAEMFDISPNAVGDFMRFRNQEYVENYKIIKLWKIPYNPTVVSLSAGGGAENEYGRKVIKVKKFFTLSDIYENDDATGVTAGMSGAGYALWVCSRAGNCTISGAVRVRFTDV